VTFNGEITFTDEHHNYGIVNGTTTFDYGSINYGTVNGNAKFKDYDLGSSIFIHQVDGSNDYYGTGIVNGNIYDVNDNLISSFDFSNGVSNNYVLDRNALFQDTTYNNSTIHGDVNFIGNSYNRGTINGNVTFNTTHYASTTLQNGIFNIENDGWRGYINGIVKGVDNIPVTLFNFYNSTVNYGTTTAGAVFYDSSRNAGTVTGNAKFNTNYYSGSVPTTSTLTVSGNAEWRGIVTGNIFASDGTTEITGFNFTDAGANYTTINSSATTTFSGTASNNGTINGNALYNGINFRIGTVNGTATLDGMAQTIQGVNNVINFVKQLFTPNRDTLTFTAGSTLNVSGLMTLLGYNQDNLLTVRTTSPNSTATVNMNGTENINFLRIKNILNGGPTVDLSSLSVFNDGGNSGFTFPSNSSASQRGGITGNFTAPTTPPPTRSSSPSTPSTPSNNGGGSPGTRNNFNNLKPGETTVVPSFSFFDRKGNNFNPGSTGATVIPWPFKDFRPIQQIVFTPTVPVKISISKFLFAPLPQTVSDVIKKIPQIASVLSSSNISREQDLAALSFKPINLPNQEKPEPGKFVIKSGNTELISSVTYDISLKTVAQLIKVSPNESLSVLLIPLSEGDVKATYLDQVLNFKNTESNIYFVDINTPFSPGRYILKTESSPIPLIIEVIAPQTETTTTDTSKPWGVPNFIWKLFN
jgi:hypothetical protein